MIRKSNKLTNSAAHFITVALIIFLGITLIKQQGVNGQQDFQAANGRQQGGMRAPVGEGGVNNNKNNNELSNEINKETPSGSGTQTSSSATVTAALAMPNFSSSSSGSSGPSNVVPQMNPYRGSANSMMNLDGTSKVELDQPATRRPANRRPLDEDDERVKPYRPRPYSNGGHYDRDEDDDGESHHGHNDDDDDDDDDDYYDLHAHPEVHPMMFNPMRQFSRMFSDAFDEMRPNFNFPFASYRRNPAGGSAISSSAYSNVGPYDYSRVQSTVTKNGKTRGILAETRNGRTQIKRYGDDYE